MEQFNENGCIKCNATVFSRKLKYLEKVRHNTANKNKEFTPYFDDLNHQFIDGIEVTCERCGYFYLMFTADHPEKGLKGKSIFNEQELKHEVSAHAEDNGD